MSSADFRIDQLVTMMQEGSGSSQSAFSWEMSHQRWLEVASEFRIDIRDIPLEIDRNFLWSMEEKRFSVEKQFMAIMIWGYGNTGYGPYRVRKMLESFNFTDAITTVHKLCREDEVLAAYEELEKSKIKQLGPAFGTKLLSFFHAREDAPPILDSLVAKWCNRYFEQGQCLSGLRSSGWNSGNYERYWTWMKLTASVRTIEVSTLEQLIFEDQRLSN